MANQLDIIEALQRDLGWTAREAEAALDEIEAEGHAEGVTEGRDHAFADAYRIALSELYEGHVVVERLRTATSRKKALAELDAPRISAEDKQALDADPVGYASSLLLDCLFPKTCEVANTNLREQAFPIIATLTDRLKTLTDRLKKAEAGRAYLDAVANLAPDVVAARKALDEWIGSALTAMWSVSWDACNHFNRGPGHDLYDNPSAEVKKRVGEPPIDRLLEAVRKERT